MSNFSERFKELRAAIGLSQQALADEMHLTKSSINMYERGEREPGLETLELFADYFNVDFDYLIGKSDIPRTTLISTPKIELPQPLPAEDSDLLSKYHALDNYGKGTVNTILNREYDRCTNNSNTTTIYRAARSADHHAAEVVTTTKDFSKMPRTKTKL